MFSSQSDLTECLERQSEHRRVINSCTEINYCSLAALQAGLIGLLSSSNDHSDSHNNPNCPAIQEQAEILFSGDTERHRETQRDTEGQVYIDFCFCQKFVTARHRPTDSTQQRETERHRLFWNGPADSQPAWPVGNCWTADLLLLLNKQRILEIYKNISRFIKSIFLCFQMCFYFSSCWLFNAGWPR